MLEDRFTAPLVSFTRQLTEADDNLTRLGNNLSAFSSRMTGVGVAMSAITAGLGAAAYSAIGLAGSFEQTNIAFTTMLGSGEKAKVFLDELSAFAAATPFQFDDLTTASKRLLALGFEAKDLIPTLRAVGDAAAGLGGGSELINRITLALGQMKTLGKVAGGEIRQLAEAGIPAWQFLADKIGKTIPEAMKMAEKGAIDANFAIGAIMEGMTKKFGGMMEAQSKTMSGMMSTLKDELSFIMRDFGMVMLPVVKEGITLFMKLIPVLKAVMEAFKAMTNSQKLWLMGLAGAAASIGPIILSLAGIVRGLGMMSTALGTVQMTLTLLGNVTIIQTANLGKLTIATVLQSAANLPWIVSMRGALVAEVGLTSGTLALTTVMGALTVTMSAVAVGFATYYLTKWIVEATGLDLIVGNLIVKFNGMSEAINSLNRGGGSVAAITKGLDSSQFDATAAGMQKWQAAMVASEAKAKALRAETIALGRAVEDKSKAVALDIKGMIQQQKNIEMLEKATKLLGREGTPLKMADLALAKETIAIAKSMDEAGKGAKNWEREQRKLNKELDDFRKNEIAEEVKKLNEAFAYNDKIMGLLGPTLKDVGKEFREIQDAVKAFGNDMTRLNDKELVTLITKLRELYATGKLSAEGLDMLGEALKEAAGRGDEVGTQVGFVTEKVVKLEDAVQTNTKSVVDWGNAWMAASEFFGQFSGMAGDLFGAIGDVSEQFKKINLNEEFDDATKSAEKFKASMQGIVAVGRILQNSTTPAIQKMGAALSGAGSGAMFGASVSGGNPYVMVIGAIVGAVTGWIKKSKELDAQLLAQRNQFIQSQGGMNNLAIAAAKAGISLDAMFRAKSAKELGIAIDDIKAKLLSWSEANEAIDDAMERWGITISELGPKFKQQRLDVQAMDLYKDWKVLLAAGVDMNVLLDKMGPGFIAYVNEVRKAGVTIPEALRGPIEALIKQGKIVDENGKAFTSAEDAGITFAQSLEEGIAKTIEAINRLIDAILGIGRMKVPTITIPVRTEREGDTGEGPGGGGGGGGGDKGFATGGVISKPSTIRVGERGPETVTPLGREAVSAMMGDRGRQFLPVTVRIDGRSLVECILEIKRDNKYGGGAL